MCAVLSMPRLLNDETRMTNDDKNLIAAPQIFSGQNDQWRCVQFVHFCNFNTTPPLGARRTVSKPD